jgi:hypothetical protein
MAACEKCWADSRNPLIGDDSDSYRRLLEERKDNPCTPEQQCGELHVRDDSGNCRCGKYPAKREGKP